MAPAHEGEAAKRYGQSGKEPRGLWQQGNGPIMPTLQRHAGQQAGEEDDGRIEVHTRGIGFFRNGRAHERLQDRNISRAAN